MNISKVASLTGMSSKMIRYYEEIGLIPKTLRTSSGYRDYTLKDIKRLQFIYNARQLGFSLEDIKNLLMLWQDEQRHSSDVKKIAEQHVNDLKMKIENMQKMVNDLQQLINCCSGNHERYCSILAQIEPSD